MTSDNSTDPVICSRCGKAKRQGEAPGTITQWLTICKCDQLPLEQEVGIEERSAAVSICASCGKRVFAGRKGSFTQWIFRSDICRCTHPKIEVGYVHASGQPVTTDRFGHDDWDEELPLENPEFEKRYEEICSLGQGASGTVTLCHDSLLKKKVAVKRPNLVSGKHVIRFQQEARAISRLHHANIVTVLDFGADHRGSPYLVMDYIEGESLRNHLQRNGPLAVDEALAIFTRLADAIQHAHSLGVLHRDLTSANVLLFTRKNKPDSRTTGSAKKKTGTLDAALIDFGIAALKYADSDNLEPSDVGGNKRYTIAGSPLYMAPDQLSGRRYDERSEVYSFGCVLFEALTGVTPFVGETALETVSMHAHHPPPGLAETNPHVQFSERLEHFIAKCLAKDQAERFQSMSEVRDYLAQEEPGSLDLEPRAVEAAEAPAGRPMVPYLVLTTFVFIGAGLITFLSGDLKVLFGEEKKSPVKTSETSTPGAKSVGHVYDSFGLPPTDEKEVRPAISAGFLPGTRILLTQGSNTAGRLKICVKERKSAHGVVVDATRLTDDEIKDICSLKPNGVFFRECTNLTSNMVRKLGQAGSIKDLGVVSCKLDDKTLAALLLTPVTQLAMRRCDLNDKDLARFQNMSQRIRKLDLSSNPKITLDGLLQLKGHDHLASINTFGCAASERPASEIRAAEKVLALELRNLEPYDVLTTTGGKASEHGQIIFGPPENWGI